jgi:uncharacterized protein (TIGR03437 family)
VNTGQVTGNVVQGFGLAPLVNAFSPPSCCETLAQFQTDFSQAVLTPSSLSVDVSGNQSGNASGLVVNASTANGYPRLGVGSFAAAYGSGFAATPLVASPPFPIILGGFSVTVKDSAGVTRSAPIQSVYPNQVNYIVPDGTAPGIATVTIGTSSGAAQVDAIGPGLYSMSGTGQGVAAATAAIYAANGTVTPQNVFQCNSSGSCVSAPMSLGNPGDQLVVTFYGTGLRNNSGLPNSSILIGGARASLLYLGAQPQYPGLDQANVIVPASLAGTGEVPVVLTVDGQTANVVTVNVK